MSQPACPPPLPHTTFLPQRAVAGIRRAERVAAEAVRAWQEPLLAGEGEGCKSAGVDELGLGVREWGGQATIEWQQSDELTTGVANVTSLPANFDQVWDAPLLSCCPCR
eukprot:1513340-Alexandrium_andersonii.AAC.1